MLVKEKKKSQEWKGVCVGGGNQEGGIALYIRTVYICCEVQKKVAARFLE